MAGHSKAAVPARLAFPDGPFRGGHLLLRRSLPDPPSSGLNHRHRTNRSGDRRLNRALHTITLIRMRLDPATKTYVTRGVAEGKTSRDAQRCLERAICRQLFKTLERSGRRLETSREDLPQAA